MAITGDDQWEWRSFKVGDGTNFPVVLWDPGAPRVRRRPADRVNGHGTILPRYDLLTGREPMLQLEVEGDSRSDLQDQLDALDAATVPVSSGDEELRWQILGDERFINARPSPARWTWGLDADTGLLVANVVVEFYAQDPRIYTDLETITVLE